LRSQIAADEDLLQQYNEACAAGNMPFPMLTKALEKLQPRIAANRHLLAAAGISTLTQQVQGPGAAARWEGLTLEEKRLLIADHVERVVIHPARKRGPKPEPESIVVIQRDAD
jgi:hypothetical protein